MVNFRGKKEVRAVVYSDNKPISSRDFRLGAKFKKKTNTKIFAYN